MELAGALVGIGIAAFFASLGLLAKAFATRTDKKKWLLAMAASLMVFLIGIQLGAKAAPDTAKKPTSPDLTPTPAATAPPRMAVTASSLSEAAYIRTVKRQKQNTGAFLSNLDKLFSQPQWEDRRWHDSAVRAISQFDSILDEGEKLVPPDSMQEIHHAYMENINDWRAVLSYLTQAVSNPEARSDPNQAFAQARERAIKSAKNVEALISAAENKSK